MSKRWLIRFLGKKTRRQASCFLLPFVWAALFFRALTFGCVVKIKLVAQFNFSQSRPRPPNRSLVFVAGARA
jgi:hypothetical protein